MAVQAAALVPAPAAAAGPTAAPAVLVAHAHDSLQGVSSLRASPQCLTEIVEGLAHGQVPCQLLAPQAVAKCLEGARLEQSRAEAQLVAVAVLLPSEPCLAAGLPLVVVSLAAVE